ncbi:hypothetical protein BKA62DRAFT_683333 [Auriculariales sp. MPI-PUGE-AT-0066]|nr:hypothetical protein BKA62DRAFT_683333 [Auriculariales sp. MPI-PUGE-AT-0066]
MLTRLSAGVAACTLIFAAALWWAHAKRTPLAPDMEDTERIPTEGEGQEIENDQQLYDYYLVLDVEGTCIAGSTMNWPNEIIEWPVVLLGWQDTPQGTRELSVLDEFRSYVRPTFRPKLSEFCTQLTGITQSDVDSAETWKEVIKRFNRWILNH